MATASFQFILFGLAIAGLSNVRRSARWRSAVLLSASIGFLWILAPEWTQLLPLTGFLLLGYLGIVIVRRGRAGSVAVTLSIVVALYVWLRKYTFLPHGLFLKGAYLALGLSYILFRVLHLIIESAGSATPPDVSMGGYLTYTLNFSTLISGPIQRYSAFAGDLLATEPPGLDAGVIAAQIERIMRGYFKVNVVALLLNIVHEDALAQLTHAGAPAAKAGAALELVAFYPLFLYANFSGYIDIVIALARLMRIRLPENFDRPFSASSFMEFWNRWHITLSTWLKTYVYNPLLVALSRKWPAAELQSSFAVFSLFVTFFLIGIWHGRTSEFTLYGVLSGVGVAVNLMCQLWLIRRLGRKRYRQLANHPVYEAACRGLTFTWFSFTLSWFWADWRQIETAYAALGAYGWAAVWSGLWALSTLLLATWEWLRVQLLRLERGGSPILTGPYGRAAWSTAMVFVWFYIVLVISQPAPDIVYKAF